MKKAFKFQDYTIEEDNNRNVSLFVNEDSVCKRKDHPKGKEVGEVYKRKTHLGFYQKPEILLERIFSDSITIRMIRIGIVEDLLGEIHSFKSELREFYVDNKEEMENIFP